MSSSFYDDASLVVIPSGYKTSKVYAEKPTDGSGDLAFTRTGDTASRVNSAGLIEKVRTNQYFKSTALITSSIYSNYNTTPTSLGTFPVYSDSLAYSFPITGGNQGFIFTVANDSQIRAISIYLKDFGTLDMFWTGSAPLSYGATSEIINGYTRYLVVIPAGANTLFFRPNGNSGTATTVYATAPQIEYGDIATAYISNSTTASVVSVGPVANVPRLDYTGSTCPRLLLEPQRTNLVTYSEQLNNAAWTKTNCTISANAATSPDGYQNADNIVTTAANSDIGRLTATVSANSETYIQSAFFKWVSGYELVKYRIALSGGTGQSAYLTFNARTGAFSASDTTYKIESYGNGWYRVMLQITNNGTNTALITQIYPTNETTQTQTVSAWGFQMENSAYLTSYIPTLAASATRGADIASKAGITSLIGQTEGTFFVDFQTLAISSSAHSIFGVQTPSTDLIRLYQEATSGVLKGQVYLNSGTTNFHIITSTTLVVGTRYKIAFAYKSGSFAIYVNGQSVGTSTTAVTFTSLSGLSLNNYFAGATLDPGCMTTNQALLFTTRLTNAALAELTTL